MMNLRISFQKIVMHLFFLLAIFNSLKDEDSVTITLNPLENNSTTAVTTADIFNGDSLAIENCDSFATTKELK